MVSIGQTFPSFELSDLDSKSRDSQEWLGRGRVLVTVYKASCPVCQQTLPYLDRLAAGGQLPVILISQDDLGTAVKFNHTFSIRSAPTLIESKGYPLSNKLGITTVPSLFLVDNAGKIVSSWTGFSKADMESLESYSGVPVFTEAERSSAPVFRPG